MMATAMPWISSGMSRSPFFSGTRAPSTRNIGGSPDFRWMSEAPPLTAILRMSLSSKPTSPRQIPTRSARVFVRLGPRLEPPRRRAARLRSPRRAVDAEPPRRPKEGNDAVAAPRRARGPGGGAGGLPGASGAQRAGGHRPRDRRRAAPAARRRDRRGALRRQPRRRELRPRPPRPRRGANRRLGELPDLP